MSPKWLAIHLVIIVLVVLLADHACDGTKGGKGGKGGKEGNKGFKGYGGKGGKKGNKGSKGYGGNNLYVRSSPFYYSYGPSSYAGPVNVLRRNIFPATAVRIPVNHPVFPAVSPPGAAVKVTQPFGGGLGGAVDMVNIGDALGIDFGQLGETFANGFGTDFKLGGVQANVITSKIAEVADKLDLKWCRIGNVAPESHVFSSTHPNLDSCCRDHDMCDFIVEPAACKGTICNRDLFPILSCDCEINFRRCLQSVSGGISHVRNALVSPVERQASAAVDQLYFVFASKWLPNRKCAKSKRVYSNKWTASNLKDLF